MLQDSRLLQPDRVLVLLAEVENCSFCKRVKDDFLLPLTMDPEWAPLFQVMLIDLNSQQMLTDFSAQRISQQDLAAALSADFSPTLIFLNPRSGERIGEDIVGLVTPDFYGFYLQQQIAQSYDLLTGQL
jgi:thioredoxin-related protein